MKPPDHSPSSEIRGGLATRSFLGFLTTQFLGAVNDNMFRWLIVPIAKYQVQDRPNMFPVILGVGLACFVAPYILLAPYAGFLADRFSKRRVIVGCKVAEIVIMTLGVLAIGPGRQWLPDPLNLYVMFAVVALMGSQSALFGPSKMGIIPELVLPDKISSANGLVGLTTVVAVVTGTIAGGLLYTHIDLDSLTDLWLPATALIGVATAGWLSSHVIARGTAVAPRRPFPVNPFSETWATLRLVGKSRAILRVAVGIAFFWSVAALAQLNVDTFVLTQLKGTQTHVSMLLGILSVGVGLGSVLAGIGSRGRIELGIVPLGAALIVVSAVILSTTESLATLQSSYIWSGIMLCLLGVGGGLFNIPLMAYLQHHSPEETRGSILAGGNFLTFSGMLLVSFLFPMMQTTLKLKPDAVFLVTGLATIPVALYVVILVPDATLRFVTWMLSLTVYRVRVRGHHNLPERGGALLVANHVSWIDGILLLLASSRPIRMLVYADYTRIRGLRYLAGLFRVIPIKAEGGPRELLKSLQVAREALIAGDLVCIFAEGGLTRTGQLQPFQRGMMRIVDGTEAPVVPVYLDELWGSIFSFRGGRFFWKRPRQWPFPVSISFGTPLENPDNVNVIRQAVQNLGVQSVESRKSRQLIPARQFLRQCRGSLFRSKVADSSGAELTGGKLLTGSLLFRRLLAGKVIGDDERMVGLLLPPSVGGVIANTALTLMGRVTVNLNYTLSEDVVNFCIKECGIKHVLTSRRFLEKRPYNLDATLVYLEDLKEQAGMVQRLFALFQSLLLPAFVLERMLGLADSKPDDLMTIIFTSGSTGEPKGVMLSHHNVMSNIDAVDQVFHITRDDVLLGVLPFFHSFGYTVTLWLSVTLDPKCVYHFNPLDGRTVGKLSEKHGTTILLSTPTFLRGYLKRCTTEQMHKLDLAIVGAEKLPPDLSEAFQEKFGVSPTEGYGATELSPVAAFNVPAHRAGTTNETTTKPGSVGRVMPGASAKIVDPDSGDDLGVDADGLLMITGPNVMQGYLNRPEKTAEVLQDNWYNTGDIARIDSEGFITITGRQSRFSKIGGEMVPHIRVEEELARIVGNSDGDDPDDDQPEILVAVTAVADPKKGERLIVIHKPIPKPVDEVLAALAECGLPNIWLPTADSFLEVETIPLLGTGKLDLKALKDLAIAHFEPQSTS